MRYGIGIDTGGTFTDSVIVDFNAHQVISKSKALTTRQDLKIGILKSLAGLDARLFPEIQLVALSTTLATNSIVEGKGQRVGLIMAVPDPATFRIPDRIPADEIAVIRGAHARSGNETIPLDIGEGTKTILEMKDRVDAFALSGYFSIYNPQHELVLKESIEHICRHPVVCGHELTGAVGMLERAVTAAFNARLLPVIGDLLHSLTQSLVEKGIRAPIMVVRGDGSLISEKAARSRPVETILSGPAASMIGAGWLTGLNDALVVDMGGTTTDIGVLAGSMPSVVEDGAIVGGWQTRIRSIKMWTIGLGGDSKISIDSQGSVQIGPRRVEPISHAATLFSSLEEKIGKLTETEGVRHTDFDLSFFTLTKEPPPWLEKQERQVLGALRGTVLHRNEIDQIAGPWVDLDRLSNLGYVGEICFTPSDLLHCMGSLALWDKDAAGMAANYYQRKTGLDRSALLQRVFEEILQKLELTITSTCLVHEGIPAHAPEAEELLARILRLDAQARISARFMLKKPLIAVGAPVRAYFPHVAEHLGAELIIPENADVANAIGAVTGRVVASALILVRPVRPSGYSVVPCEEEKIFQSVKEATDFAKAKAQTMAQSQAAELGAGDIHLTVTMEEVTAPLSGGWGKAVLMEIKVVALAIGQPRV